MRLFQYLFSALLLLFAVLLRVMANQGTVLPTAATPFATSSASLVSESRPASCETSTFPKDVASYNIEAELDPVLHVVIAEQVLTFTNTSAKSVNELWFHLYLNAFKNEASVFFREQFGGFRGGTRPKQWGALDVLSAKLGDQDLWPAAKRVLDGEGDETEAALPLPEPVLPGATVSIRMKFRATLLSIVERTGFFGQFHMVAQWFPKLAKLQSDGTFARFRFHQLSEFFADYGKYEVRVRVPAQYTVYGSGKRVSDQVAASPNGEVRTVYFASDHVHDFAFAAWDKFERREEIVSDGFHDVAIEYAYPKGYEAAIAREQSSLRFALPHFAERYGSYPYDRLTVVHPPLGADESGGMEYPTLITTGGSPFAPFDRRIEIVTVHEFGHQYFYGLLASNEAEEPYLDEGLNSYAEVVALESMFGTGSAGSILGLRVSLPAINAVHSAESANDEVIAKPAREFSSGASYGRLVYARTATLLSTLARVYGEPRVARALRKYACSQRFHHPTTTDLVSIIQAEFGEDIAKEFSAALGTVSSVDYAITRTSTGIERTMGGMFDAEGAGRTTRESHEGSQMVTRVLVSRRGELRFPVIVRATYADGSHQDQLWDATSRTARLAFSVPAFRGKPTSVVIDPDHRVLLDTDFRNNIAASSGPRWSERGYEVALGLGVWGAVP
jgi:Peptidase family M1 domain